MFTFKSQKPVILLATWPNKMSLTHKHLTQKQIFGIQSWTNVLSGHCGVSIIHQGTHEESHPPKCSIDVWTLVLTVEAHELAPTFLGHGQKTSGTPCHRQLPRDKSLCGNADFQ